MPSSKKPSPHERLLAMMPASPNDVARQIASTFGLVPPAAPPRNTARHHDPKRERLVRTLLALAPASPDDARQRAVAPLAKLMPAGPPLTVDRSDA